MTRGFAMGKGLVADDRKGLHPGLALGALAPIDSREGKVADKDRGGWLASLSEISVSPDYTDWYEGRWKKGLGESLAGTVEATTRLLVGAGDASATDVGLRVHHTWGVPCIPGSSLKGLLSHWLETVYGPSADHAGRSPWDPHHPEGDRAPFRRASAPAHGPGEIQRILFGSPEVDGDLDALRERGSVDPRTGTTACRGKVVIHDALFVPGSANNTPFLADVLTVHHANWYQGKGPANDHDSPNPVGFLSVRPGVQLLLAVGLAPGEDRESESWVKFTFDMLLESLADWGIGSKSAAGYGRLEKRTDPKRLEKIADDYRESLAAWLAAHRETLQALVDAPEGPAAFVRMIAEADGGQILSVTGDLRKDRRQVVLSFVANIVKEMKVSNSKSRALRKAIEERFPLD